MIFFLVFGRMTYLAPGKTFYYFYCTMHTAKQTIWPGCGNTVHYYIPLNCCALSCSTADSILYSTTNHSAVLQNPAVLQGCSSPHTPSNTCCAEFHRKLDIAHWYTSSFICTATTTSSFFKLKIIKFGLYLILVSSEACTDADFSLLNLSVSHYDLDLTYTVDMDLRALWNFDYLTLWHI